MSYRYNSVVDYIKRQVDAGTLKVGDRLPSIRQLSLLTGFSTVTIHRGYEILESNGYCAARPRSGFYLTREPPKAADFPDADGEGLADLISVEEVSESLLITAQKKTLEAFGSPHPSSDLYNSEVLDRLLRRVLRGGNRGRSDAVEGDDALRVQIAKRTAQRGILSSPKTIVITNSAMQAFNLCLDAFTSPGDAVLVESPSYFPTLSAIRRRNLRVVEIYSHPIHGTDPDQFEYLLANNPVKVALLMANNHFPTGITYPEASGKRIVRSAEKHKVTIIENDMLADLSYSDEAGSTLKHFDSSDSVIQLGSFEYSLSPEYGVAWVHAGRHAKRLLAVSYLGGYVTHDWRVQRAVAEYLSNRSPSKYLRRLRQVLAERMETGLRRLSDKLPPGCSVTQPTGGFTCWVRAPLEFSASEAVNQLHHKGIGILPGPVFSAARSFDNFFALNLSFPWTEANELRIDAIAGAIAESQQRKR